MVPRADEATRSIRRFNRAYTRVLGVLDEDFLARGRTLGASRLLFEMGDDGASVTELRDRLGLDSGYVSRLLRTLEGEGLVTTGADPRDRRRRIVRPTAAGQAERSVLDRLSDRSVDDLLTPLDDRRREQLADLLERAGRIVAASTARFVAVDADEPAARWALDEYVSELDRRFDGGFDPGEGGPAASEGGPLAFVLAEVDTDPVPDPAAEHPHVAGCGAVAELTDGVAEIKRMWIRPSWRGLGLAPRLLDHLEGRARSGGHQVVRLDTNDTLSEAIALYRSRDYREIDRYNDNPYARLWFEKPL